MKAGDKLGFNTNEAAKYGKNIRCSVNYIIQASCNKMMVSCKLKLGTGDFFFVQRDDITKKYEYTTNTFIAEYKNIKLYGIIFRLSGSRRDRGFVPKRPKAT